MYKMGGMWKEIRRALYTNKTQREQLTPADHIYTWKRNNDQWYTHHGIYAGDGKVIHLARGPDDHVSSSRRPSPSHSSDTGGVVLCSTVEDFLSGGSEQLYGFEYGANIIHFLVKFGRVTCTLANSDPPGDVLHRASSLLDISMREDVGPNIFSNSSELFAVYCKTGSLLNDSGDSDRGCEPLWSLTMAIAAISLIPRRFLPTTFTGLALVVCGFYCFFRIPGDVGNGLSEKVAVEKFDPSSYPRVQRDNMDIVDRRRRAKGNLTKSCFLSHFPTHDLVLDSTVHNSSMDQTLLWESRIIYFPLQGT